MDAELRPSSAGASSHQNWRTRLAQNRRRNARPHPLNAVQKRVVAYTYAAILFMLIYVGAIGLALFQPGYRPIDRAASLLLIFGLGFILTHGFGYANSMIKASWAYRATKRHLFAPTRNPSVTCIIACFNEPADVLDETVGSVVAMDYANKHVVILDDSTKEEARQSARDVAAKYGVTCVQRTSRRGYKAGAINDFLPTCQTEFIAVFDADALPATDFLRDVVPLIEENPKLGFVQTPQFYANTDVSNAAMASARQQNVFYEYICEGKSYSQAAFCCGTNVIFRTTALKDNNGFDESNVTEDFATSFQMHVRGWDSLYLNEVYVYSLAPENLAAYYTQQSRWSFGTLGTARLFIKEFLKNPRALRLGQWYEYFLSATYYWVGWVNFIFMILPMLYIFFGIKPLRQDVISYLCVFVPYFLFTLNMFYAGMQARKFSMGEMVLGQQIGFISFPIHMTSAVAGLLGQKRPFGVTPKGVGGKIPWKALWPQLTMMALSAVAFLWGGYKYLAGYDRNTTAIVVNSAWALYHVWMLSSVFALNQPVREGKKAFFEDPKSQAEPLLYPQPEYQIFNASRWSGRLVNAGIAVALGPLVFVGWGVFSWQAAPEVPVNVYIVDKTVGTAGQEHRALSWTLNYLKVRKEAGFNPDGPAGPRSYDWTKDYFGFVPWRNTRLTQDASHPGDMLAYAADRPLPSRIFPPGILYLADGYGEYSEVHSTRRALVRVRSRQRGFTPDEVETMEVFARRGGVIVGEWNILGYPTRPGRGPSPAQVEATKVRLRQRMQKLQRVDFAANQRALASAPRGSALATNLRRQQGRIRDDIGALESRLRSLDFVMNQARRDSAQVAAADKLEKLLHVKYSGWYGRFVANFADEAEYDRPLWESVRDELSAAAGRVVEPSGPGFVFYPDGATTLSKASGRKSSPFAQPVVITEKELGGVPGGDLALIYRSGKDGIKDDALLKGVAPTVPFRFWFDVVKAAPGSRVLAFYKLKLVTSATEKLRKAGFPAEYLLADGTVVFPAAVAWRDGQTATGELRSLYLAGDASDFPVPSALAERFPGVATISSLTGPRLGAFDSQYLWGYYEPIMRNLVNDSTALRYSGGASR